MTLLPQRLVRSAILASVLSATALVSLGAQAAQAPAVGRDASAASVASFELTQQMPVDPEVSLGTLPNGMKYYVRPNPRPARPPAPRPPGPASRPDCVSYMRIMPLWLYDTDPR